MKLIKLLTVPGHSLRFALAAPLNLGKADFFTDGLAEASQRRPLRAESADRTQLPVAEV